MASHFEVDSKGLAKLAERRGKAWVLYELLQNAWDTDAKEVSVTFELVAGRPLASLVVEDDHPDGFKNLAHAWTLFAESEKKGDATKRGRFNLGEKLVLALCQEAEIVTTTGGVRFDGDGRHTLRRKTERGSRFSALVRMTRDEYAAALAGITLVVVPDDVRTTFNGTELPARKRCGLESVTLATEVADEEGYLRRRDRRTEVHMYRPLGDEVGTLFELGIPVMETGDAYHVDVRQKVPLNMERDGVSPGYLRAVRAATLNTLAHEVTTPEEAAAPWVRDAMAHASIDQQTVERVMTSRFGTERVVFDPSDPEANNIAMSKGMTVVPGAAMSAEEWVNVRRFEAVRPAGQVTPSPKPFAAGGEELELVPEAAYTPAMVAGVALAKRVARALLGLSLHVTVEVTNDRDWPFAAVYGSRELILNYSRVGGFDSERMVQLLIHEYAHQFESNHLAEGFHTACCRLGAKLAVLAVKDPTLVRL